MNRHKYEKIVTNDREQGSCLEVRVVSGTYPGEREIYRVPLTTLDISEENLNGGRFARFVDRNLEHAFPRHLSSDESGLYQLGVYFDDMIEWMSCHTTGQWSFIVILPIVTQVNVIWFLERPEDAMLFKLSF